MPVRSVSELIRGQNVVVVSPEISVRDAAQLMSARHIGAVGVVTGERLTGIFTERDIMRRVVAEGRNPAGTTVGEVMTQELKTISAERPVIEALELMLDGHFRHVPVVEGERCIGMISMRDVPLEYCLLRERWHAARRELEARRSSDSAGARYSNGAS